MNIVRRIFEKQQVARIIVLALVACALSAFLAFAVVSGRGSPERPKSKSQPKKTTQKQRKKPIELPAEKPWKQPIQATAEQGNQAIQIVRDFEGKQDLELHAGFVTDCPWGKLCAVSSEDGPFDVDLEGKRVISHVSDHISDTESHEGCSSLKEGRRIALDYIEAHFDDFDSRRMSLTKEERQDHGTFSEYSYEWRDKSSASSITVSVIPGTDRVRSLTFLLRKGEVDPEPDISRKKAVRIAKEIIDFEVAKVGEVRMDIWFDNDGKQVLRWLVEVEGEPSGGVAVGATVIIDAHSGEVLEIMRVG